ncbi:hypothetical protein C6503_07420 [Candidatus Poribacteria bacterium]|nr:MAG: hypothetical protein C6503_07420 [Candidatus Poribacteria bacterium]
MKKRSLYLESIVSGITGVIAGGCLALIINPEGIVISVNIKFLVGFYAIMLTILGWFYLLVRLCLKSIHRATNANTAFQRGAPMVKGLLSVTESFFFGIIGTPIGGFLASLITNPGGIVINVNIEFLVILLTVLGWCYLLFRLKFEIMQLEDAATQRSGAHR